MCDWETVSAKLFARARMSPSEADPARLREAQEQARAALGEIFLRYCSKVEARRGLAYSTPPGYNPQTEVIIEATELGKTVRVVTGSEGPLMKRFVYTVERTQDGWRLLDNRKWIDSQGKEHPWSL
ncbi:MAG: hypothetical protein IPL89_16850 [Acidobacteria bacterium]|nr:hypothetical protein [Acidobacteriota bacterium]